MRIVLFDNVTVDLRASPEVFEKILKQYRGILVNMVMVQNW